MTQRRRPFSGGHHWLDGTVSQQVGPSRHHVRQGYVQGKARSGISPVLLISLISICGLFAGGVGGAIAGFATAERHGPSAPGTFPAAFPHSDGRYLKGVTVDQIAGLLTGVDKQTCKPWEGLPTISGAKESLLCIAKDRLDLPIASVTIEYDDETHVRRASADCLRSAEDYCGPLAERFAAAILVSQPGQVPVRGTGDGRT